MLFIKLADTGKEHIIIVLKCDGYFSGARPGRRGKLNLGDERKNLPGIFPKTTPLFIQAQLSSVAVKKRIAQFSFKT